MKIKSITVSNFRSIKSASVQCDGFNVFVGQNNCGKTNFFEAVEWFYSPKGTLDSIRHIKSSKNEDVWVEVEFSGAQDGAAKMKNASNQTKIKNILSDSDTISIKRSSSDIKKRLVFVNGEEKPPGTGFDTALNDFLPKFEYIHTKQYFDSVSRYDKKSPVGIMLSGVLSVILEKNEQYLDFQSKFEALFEDENSPVRVEFDTLGGKVQVYLEKQFPDCTLVKFEVTAPHFDDLLKNFETIVDDGVQTSAEEKGDGMQRALMLAIIQAYADFRKANEDTGKSFLFFIDEAELHLHPSAQRKLKKVLSELATDSDQVFINTHSSVLVTDEEENQKFFKVEKSLGETSITPADKDEKPYIIYELLGGSPSDILLPCNFLVVEGISELEFLSRIIARHYPEKPKVQILPAHGDVDQTERSVNAVEKTFMVLEKSLYKDHIAILCDKPHASKTQGFSDFLGRNSSLRTNGQVFTLPEGSIEECYPAAWKKTAAEVQKMDSHQKKSLARAAGKDASKSDFETSMPTVLKALEKAWKEAYQ